MKKAVCAPLLMFFIVSLLFCGVCAAGPAEDAKAFVQKAVEYIKANGKEKAYQEFTNGTQFKKGELYIFVLDSKYNMLAHGGNAKMVGKNFKELKDANGKAFLKEMVDKGINQGSGWTDYVWTNPVTKKIERKSSYVVKVDDTVVGCGIYKK